MKFCRCFGRTLMVLLLLSAAATAFAQDEVGSDDVEVLTPVAFGEIDSLFEQTEEFAVQFADDPTFVKSVDDSFVVPNVIDFVPPGANQKSLGGDTLDMARQSVIPLKGPTPGPSLSFAGTGNNDNITVAGVSLAPPDTEGDIGLAYYFQMNNVVFNIYDKNTGASVLPFGMPAFPNNIFWTTLTGSVCKSNNDGDPIVLFDRGAQRWVVTQFAVAADGHQCIAVSKTSNPLGGYWLYDFIVTPGGLNDYPKGGAWSDGYYFSFNEFQASFIGAAAVAFEKPQMIVGNPLAQGFKFTLPYTGAAPVHFSLQPSHWNGMNAPTAGQPNTFIQAFDDQTWGTGFGPDGYYLWDFSVDWAVPGNSTFTQLPFVTTTAFNANLCGYSPCVPQVGTGTLLDTLSQFTMYRLQWRNFSTYDTLVGNHTVNVGGNQAAVRWVELRNSGGGWSVFQTGSFAPDSTHRWMGSAAMDSSGNIALGYSASSSSIDPDVRYTSRMNGDPAGMMTGGEIICKDGTGSQTSPDRWGDYSTMSVDPDDDCTFWYTNEYYDVDSAFNWKTWICKFSFPPADCQKQFCGNNVLDLGEVCDGTDFGGQTCVSFGFDTGTLGCSADCTSISTANCCHTGKSSGVWNLPAGPSAGTMLGTIYDSSSVAIYQILATLSGTAASGTLNGTLSDGVAPDPDYTVVGSYAATGPNTGTFNARILLNGVVVGSISGPWSDNPLLPVIGKFGTAGWSICGP